MDTHTQNDHNNPINYKESSEDRAAAKSELMRDTLQTLSLNHLGEDATDYLREKDCSLSESLELAAEMGFTFEHLNSEALASLHASRHREDDFWQFVAPELDKINN